MVSDDVSFLLLVYSIYHMAACMDVVVVVVFSKYRYSSSTNTPTFRDWLIYESTSAFNLLYPHDVTFHNFYGTGSNLVSHTSRDDCSTNSYHSQSILRVLVTVWMTLL